MIETLGSSSPDGLLLASIFCLIFYLSSEQSLDSLSRHLLMLFSASSVVDNA